MSAADDIYDELVERLERYRLKYVGPYLPVDPQVTTEMYELDVMSYCMLSHAALEDYFERIALAVMHNAVQEWTVHQRPSRALVMLLLRYSPSLGLAEDDAGPEKRVFNHIREALGESKDRFSKDVFGNHGASPKYLRRLLVPVGLDFEPDANTRNSLEKLVAARGQYAHHGFVTVVTTPEDASDYVNDCLSFAGQIRANANAVGLI